MGAPHHIEGWTEPRVARLRKLWLEGFSATQIAADLGGGVTRNACIAKIRRLGLSGRASPSSPAQVKPRAPAKPRPTPAAPRPLAADATEAAPRVAPAPLPPEPEVQGAQMVTILELPAHACKWPVGFPQPVQLFCGRRRHEQTPYCAEHAKVAYSSASALAKHSASELVRSVRRYI